MFNLGDKVEVKETTRGMENYFGKVFTVTHVDRSNVFPYRLVCDDNPNLYNVFDDYELRLATPDD